MDSSINAPLFKFPIDNSLILHRQIQLKEPNEVILFSIFFHPEYCALTDNEGNYPLHLAVFNAYPIQVIESIIEAFPQAVKLTNSTFKSTPLHLAMSSSFDVVKKLVYLYPSACNLPDIVGKYPIHQFCMHKVHSVEHLRILIRKNPEAVHKKDNFGRRPWDIAITQYSDDEIFRALLNADPRGLCPAEYKLYKNANWNARKAMMRVIAKCACSFMFELPKQENSCLDPRLVHLIIRLSQLPDSSGSGRKVLQYFFLIHPYSKNVKNKFLQNILYYL